MTRVATTEFFQVFNARRVKAPELKGPDLLVNALVGWVKNRQPYLKKLRAQAARIEKLEPEIHNLSAAKFKEAVEEMQAVARLGKMKGELLDRGMAVVREGC